MPEIERKFSVYDLTHPLRENALRQAYLAVDGAIEVRVRNRGGTSVLGAKGGQGIERTVGVSRPEQDSLDGQQNESGGARPQPSRRTSLIRQDLSKNETSGL